MVWSYTQDPQNVPVDAVRLLVGDTDTDDQLIQNEEIEFALSIQADNVYLAAADVADMLSARFTRSVSLSVEGLSAQFERRAVAFAELAMRLRQMNRRRKDKKYRKFLDEQFTTHKPAFDVGMHDFIREPHQVVDD